MVRIIEGNYQGELRLYSEADDLTRLHIDILLKAGKEGDPTALLYGFMFAVDSGYLPPEEIIRDIYRRFNEYDKDKGDRSLDKCFDLTSPGRGKPPPIKKLERDAKDLNRAFLVWVLDNHFNISIGDAATAVHIRECDSSKQTGLEKVPDATWIEESYSKTWKKICCTKFESMRDFWDNKENRKKFIDSFPAEAFTGVEIKI